MKGKRLFFLDNLKMFIVNLMIIFHLAMCYMAYAPEWWYVVDVEHSDLFFTQFILWADIFSMPIMFFVAGYFGIMSLKKQSAIRSLCGFTAADGMPEVRGFLISSGSVRRIRDTVLYP